MSVVGVLSAPFLYKIREGLPVIRPKIGPVGSMSVIALITSCANWTLFFIICLKVAD
jgi:hypothetical protein